MLAYLRVSTEDQSLGLEAQCAACERYGELRAVYIDRISGASEPHERPGLSALLASLESGETVIASRRDRFARDPMVMGTIEALVSRARASLVTADGTSNTSTPEGRLMGDMLDAFARHERSVIRHRTKAALAAKRARGELTGTAPYGWRVGPDGTHLEPDTCEQAVRAIVASLRADGRSYRWIAGWLDAAGLKNRAGNAWCHQRVARIVSLRRSAE